MKLLANTLFKASQIFQYWEQVEIQQNPLGHLTITNGTIKFKLNPKTNKWIQIPMVDITPSGLDFPP